jgi:hypothetical protein
MLTKNTHQGVGTLNWKVLKNPSTQNEYVHQIIVTQWGTA